MPNVMATLPNIGGTLCSMPQSLARLILECRAVTLPRRETRWNFQECPKLMKRSQPLVSRSSPYCKDMWRRYCCLTSFFQLSICALVAKIQTDKTVNLLTRDSRFHSSNTLAAKQPRPRQELIRRWDSERELFDNNIAHVEASAYTHWTSL